MLLGVTSIGSVVSASIGAGGGAVAALGGHWIAARRERERQSGTVATSEASELWDAINDFNEQLTAEVKTLRERLDATVEANDGLRMQLLEAQKLAATLQRQVGQLTRANRDLERMNDDLTGKVAHLTALVERYETHETEGGTTR